MSLLCWHRSPVKLIKLLLYIDLCAAGLSREWEEWGAACVMSWFPKDQRHNDLLQST